MAKCPNGHESTWDDFCSSCGEAISSEAGGPGEATGGSDPATTPDPVAPDAGGLECPNCGTGRAASDVFCENCGYDFASGSLPEGDGEGNEGAPVAAGVGIPGAGLGVGGTIAPDTGTSAGSAPEPDSAATSAAPEAPVPVPEPDAPSSGDAEVPSTATTPVSGVVAVIEVDSAFFERVAAGGELQLPDREPPEVRVSLKSSEVLVGRRSDSRGVYPEIDLSPPTDDPAVSHRHAMLRRKDDGGWTATDLDSTNGSYFDDETTAMRAGDERDLPFGTPIYVGAWSKITIEEASP